MDEIFERYKFENILSSMMGRISNKLDKREGSVIYDALAPAAKELEDFYFTLVDFVSETFADTASREYLIRRAKERGLSPYDSSKAVLLGEFNVDVDLGTRFSKDDLNYIVTKKLGYNDSKNTFEHELTCEQTGRIGNTVFGKLIPISYVPNLTRAELVELVIPGEDEEDTERFRKRYFESFNTKAYGGNILDYKNKVLEIDGVGAVKVKPVWNGGGTVLLTIIDSEFNKASQTLVNKVQQEIDPTQDGTGIGVAPIGHVVTVQTVTEKKINISTSLTYETGYSWSDVESKVKEVIENYLLTLRKNWSDKENVVNANLIVRLSSIIAEIIDVDGIVDAQNTKLNGKTVNITLNEYEVPVLGGISS